MLISKPIISQSVGTGTESSVIPQEVFNPVQDSLMRTEVLCDSVPSGMAEVADIFGRESFIPDLIEPVLKESLSFLDNIFFQLITVGLLIIYSYVLLNNRLEVGSLFKAMSLSRNSIHKLSDDQHYLPHTFVNGIALSGLLMCGIIAIKVADLWMHDLFYMIFSDNAPFVIFATTIVVLVVILLYQTFILRITGLLTFSQGFIKRLLLLRRLFLMVVVVLTTPFAILLALASSQTTEIVIYYLAGITLLLVIYFIYRSIKLFIEEKISIFLWIIYLCAVEVLPYCVFVLAISNNF